MSDDVNLLLHDRQAEVMYLDDLVLACLQVTIDNAMQTSTYSTGHLCEQHALFLYVFGHHFYAWSSEDILAVITDKLGQQQEAELNAMEGRCKAGLKGWLLCHRMLPYLQ